MKYKFKALFLSMLVILFVSLATPLSALADTAEVDLSKKGSIEITLKYKKKAIPGAEFTIYKVGNAKQGSRVYFEYTSDFEAFSAKTETLSESDSPKKLVKYIKKNDISGKKRTTDDVGYVKFSKLSLGLYLVVQTNGVDGYSKCSPFFVYLPYEEDGQWLYSIDATPKTDVSVVTTNPNTVPIDGDNTNPDYNDEGKLTTTTTLPYDPDDPDDPNNPNNPNNPDNPNYNPNHTTKPYVTDEYGNPVDPDNPDGNSSSGNGNKDDEELIKTGQNKMIVPVLASLGMLLFFSGCCLYSRDKKENC